MRPHPVVISCDFIMQWSHAASATSSCSHLVQLRRLSCSRLLQLRWLHLMQSSLASSPFKWLGGQQRDNVRSSRAASGRNDIHRYYNAISGDIIRPFLAALFDPSTQTNSFQRCHSVNSWNTTHPILRITSTQSRLCGSKPVIQGSSFIQIDPNTLKPRENSTKTHFSAVIAI